MGQTSATQLKHPRRRITPVTVCQAIHDAPYIAARAVISGVRAVGHCLAWTWDAVATDARENWRWFCDRLPPSAARPGAEGAARHYA